MAAYKVLRDAIEAAGGTMEFKDSGYLHGAWEVRLQGKTGIFPWNDGMFTGLDELHVPKLPNPTHYSHFHRILMDGWLEALSNTLDEKNGVHRSTAGTFSRARKQRLLAERDEMVGHRSVVPEQVEAAPQPLASPLPADNADLVQGSDLQPRPRRLRR